MKYKISRTSNWWGVEQPCKKAYKENHEWYIDINSIEEIQELIDEVKTQVIIGFNDIEIYDDYRE
jgi:hypothetical protein